MALTGFKSFKITLAATVCVQLTQISACQQERVRCFTGPGWEAWRGAVGRTLRAQSTEWNLQEFKHLP